MVRKWRGRGSRRSKWRRRGRKSRKWRSTRKSRRILQRQRVKRKTWWKPGGISGGLLGGKLLLFLSSLMSSLCLKRFSLVCISLFFYFSKLFFISSSNYLLPSSCVNKFPNTGFCASNFSTSLKVTCKGFGLARTFLSAVSKTCRTMASLTLPTVTMAFRFSWMFLPIQLAASKNLQRSSLLLTTSTTEF